MIALDASFHRGSRGAREGVARETLRGTIDRGGEGGCGRHHGVADRVDTGVSGRESAPNAPLNQLSFACHVLPSLNRPFRPS